MSRHHNFLEAVKSRKKPNADVEIGRLSTMLCHLGNVSYKLGRDVRFDPKTEKFGDAEANKLLRKEYRESVKRNMPKEWFDPLPHTHEALDDALEQGALFCNMLKANGSGRQS